MPFHEEVPLSIRKAPISVRVAAMLVGLIAALAPAALLAYDARENADGTRVVAQASPTAAPKATTAPTAAPKATAAATPAAAPKTGTAGIAGEAGTAGVAALLIALTVGVVAGGRVLAARRS
jgi:hypothetical protein